MAIKKPSEIYWDSYAVVQYKFPELRHRKKAFLPNFSWRFLESFLAFIQSSQETLHFHDDEKVEAIDALEAQVADSNLEGGKSKEASGTSTKNLLMNWQLMSAVILYCIFCLHDTAYLEVISILYFRILIKWSLE
jgi:hypothetical protein